MGQSKEQVSQRSSSSSFFDVSPLIQGVFTPDRLVESGLVYWGYWSFQAASSQITWDHLGSPGTTWDLLSTATATRLDV